MSPALASALTAIIVSVLGLVGQALINLKNGREKRKHEILKERQDALIAALLVIDRVYANSEFNERPAALKHTWHMSDAWSAFNRILVYCENPSRTANAFMRAIGTHNPEVEGPRAYSPADLDAFRRIVCDELKTVQDPGSLYSHKDRTWIASLPGATLP